MANVEKRLIPHNRTLEYFVALGSFIAAVVFAFVSLSISDYHEVAAGNCTIVAQFLLLTASIFGIDYKLNAYGKTNTHEQEPTRLEEQ